MSGTKLYGQKKLDWLLKLHTKIIYYTNFKQDILIMKPLYQFSRNTEKKIWCGKGEGYKFTWNTSPIYLAWFVKKRSKRSVSHSVISNSLRPHEPAMLLCPWNSPGKKTGVGCHSLLQGNLPNPGIEPRSSALQAGYLPSDLPGKLL